MLDQVVPPFEVFQIALVEVAKIIFGFSGETLISSKVVLKLLIIVHVFP